MLNLTLYEKKKLIKSLDNIDAAVGIIIEKDKMTYDKYFNKLRNVLVNAYESQIKTALNDVIDYLVGLDKESFSEEDIAKINGILKSKLGDELYSQLEKPILDLTQSIYKFGVSEIGKSVGMKLAFDIADEEAAAILGNQNMFWVGDYYGSKLSGEIGDILKGYYTENKTIEQVAKDFEMRFGDVTEKGTSYFDMMAKTTTTRVRELGHITGYEKAGVTRYEIVAQVSDRTCELCLEMNGKTFEVSAGAEFRDTILGLSDPAEIKNIAPWRTAEDVKGLSAAEMPVGMQLPEFHANCNCTTVAYFE